MKMCSKCGETKALSEFATNKSRAGKEYPYSQCKSCVRQRNRDYYRNNADKVKAAVKKYKSENEEKYKQYNRSRRLARHGLSDTLYAELLELQNGACAICKIEFDVLHIDHDHAHCSGPFGCAECIRGLLCDRCNRGIGYFADDTTRLQSAIAYLTK